MAGRMTRVDKTQNMARFWEYAVQPGLFGDICVTRYWGRIGTIGQSTENWFADELQAKKWAGNITQQKVRRGYS